MQPVPLCTCNHDSRVDVANIREQQTLPCLAVRRSCVILDTSLLPSLKRPQPVCMLYQGHVLRISLKEFGVFTCLAT